MTCMSLVIIADLPVSSLEQELAPYGYGDVRLLNLTADADDVSKLVKGDVLSIGEYLDPLQVRDEFLRFLDAWPKKPLSGGKGFDDLFRRTQGYSVWWTSVGVERNPKVGAFPVMKL